MPRARNAVATHRRKRRLRKATKGFWGARGRLKRVSLEAAIRSQAHAYEGRKQRKRQFRRLWITRINAAARQRGMSYSQLIDGLSRAGSNLDRKMLAEIAVSDEPAFDRIVALAADARQQS
jgi:large subunit ribosomal protein L20